MFKKLITSASLSLSYFILRYESHRSNEVYKCVHSLKQFNDANTYNSCFFNYSAGVFNDKTAFLVDFYNKKLWKMIKPLFASNLLLVKVTFLMTT